jgi:FkbM family methyltransferase
MLISFEEINKILSIKNINISGVFHIGSHDCEELQLYNDLGIPTENIIWIDANPSKVSQTISKGIPNVYNAVITDKDDEDIIFNISNNTHSSSILEFGTHSQEYPGVIYINKLQAKSITIDTFFERNNIDATKYDFWNFDIQGAELMALKGATQSIKYAKVLYLEVNEKELYTNCGLIDEIDDFLSQYNFKRVLTDITQYGWGDALYILDIYTLEDLKPHP